MEKIARFVAKLVEGRDPDLAAHHQRLGGGADLFARHLGLSSAEADLLCFGARIHDIGKLSISEHILNKPASLTAAEFSMVKRHAELGGDLLAPLDLDPRVMEIVLLHHEDYDGSGYPHGLAGDAIPLFARMVRILDSFDALTTNRPYHQGVSGELALRRLEHNSHRYDPDLLTHFCRAVREAGLA